MCAIFQLMLKCTSRKEVPQLVSQVYTDHCTDSTDRLAVKALVETLARYATQPIAQVLIGVAPLNDYLSLLTCANNCFICKKAYCFQEALKILGYEDNTWLQTCQQSKQNMQCDDWIHIEGERFIYGQLMLQPNQWSPFPKISTQLFVHDCLQ